MKRSPPSLQFLAASASTHTSMSSRPPYRGGRNQWRRGFSDRPHGDERDLFVTGDSHFQSVRDSNLGFRPVERGNFANNRAFRPQPPPNFYQNQPYPPIQQFGPPFNQSQQFGPPRWTQNQPFRPQQQFRPRPPKPLDYRNWEFAKPGPVPQCERFTVLSYNILADYLAINHRSKLYFHIPRHILDWEWRKRSIIFELGLWSADILCFQEVDRFQELEEELKLRGYDGIWKMRTGDPVDGCAIFWRVSRFKLLHEECIEFNKLGLRDNVAQICVLESVKQNDTKSTSAFPTSSTGPNKVVICNIHVLYNPKRGEIKLGQVRVLLERANAASKLWDDAPIVLCGDFNCTPKSPLYNYVSEQKLNLSGLSRYEVSRQASAEILAPRQFSPSLGPQSAQNSVRDRTTVDAREVKQGDSLLNVLKQNGVDSNVENDLSMTSSFQPQCINTAVDVSDNSFFNGQYGNNDNALVHDLTQETSQDEAELTICVPLSGLKESPRSFHKESGLSDDKVKVKTHEGTDLETHDGDIYSNMIKTGHGEKEDVTFDAKYGSSSEPSLSNLSTENEIISHDKGGPSTSSKDNVSCELTNIDIVVGEKSENLSLHELVEVTKEDENLGEDCNTFLSALHDTNSAPFPSDFSEFVRPDISEIGDEVLDDDSFGIDSVPVDVLKTTYDPSTWTPMEIEAATGNAECTFMEHPLKLRSSYTEVEDCSGARDSNGEPLVTSYHRCFLGTVDYIWRSEGLQTVRVLAPIPKHAMQWTPGFPTKKWGSDHIALVSELAFTENTSTQDTEAQ